MAKLIIIGHLEKADTLTPDGFLFGYTLSVGWSEKKAPDAADPSPLLPWTWNAITHIQLFGRKQGVWQPIGAFEKVSPSPTLSLTALETEASARYAKASSIVWPDPTTSMPIDKLDVNETSDPWPAHVLDLASYPYPIPQNLNLSFVFNAAQDMSSFSDFSAAPVLNDRLSGSSVLPFNAFQPGVGTNSNGFVSYNQGAGTVPFDIVATCNIVAKATAPSSAGWDPITLGVPLLSAHLADWQQEFLLGASSLFSLPDFIQFLLSPANANPFPLEWIPTLLKAGIGSLRDLVSPGLDGGPLQSFRDFRLLLEQYPAVPDDIRKNGYREAFPTLESWQAFLKSEFPSLKNLSIWEVPVRNDTSPLPSDPTGFYGQLIREFNAVVAPIADFSDASVPSEIHSGPSALERMRGEKVMEDLWNKLLDAVTPSQQVDDLRKRIPSGFVPMSYSSAWLDDTLGMAWNNILNNGGSGNNPFVDRLISLSTYFLLGRLGLPLTIQDTPANPPNFWRTIPMDWFPLQTQAARWSNLKSAFQAWISAWQTNRTSQFQPSVGSIPVQASRNPLAVHLQFASFSVDEQSDQDSVTPGETDFLRDIRGVGLLVQEQNAPAWTPANLNAAIGIDNKPIGSDPVGFPLRPAYIAKLRRGLIAYDSEPLAGGTALDNIAGLQGVLKAPKDVRPPLVSADYHDSVVTPQLKSPCQNTHFGNG